MAAECDTREAIPSSIGRVRGISTTLPLDAHAAIVAEADRRNVPISTIVREVLLAAVAAFPQTSGR